jgi:hypothetical protein
MGQTARKNNKKLDGRRDMSPTYQLCAGRQNRITGASHQWHIGGGGLAGCIKKTFPVKNSRQEVFCLAHRNPRDSGFNIADLDGNADSGTMQVGKQLRGLLLWQGQH